MKAKYYKFILAFLLALSFFFFFYFNVSQYFQLEYVKSQQDKLMSLYSSYPVGILLSYFFIYIVVTALSIPGALILTVLSGFLFGFIKGALLVSFASTIGATMSFLISRFLLRDFFTRKFKNKLSHVSTHLEKEGAFYLFTLRLIPLIPFFIINIVMGLSAMKVRTFFFISQIGMLPMTFVYVNAGDQLAQINSLKDLLSFKLILSFALVAFSSVIITKIWTSISSQRKR